MYISTKLSFSIVVGHSSSQLLLIYIELKDHKAESVSIYNTSQQQNMRLYKQFFQKNALKLRDSTTDLITGSKEWKTINFISCRNSDVLKETNTISDAAMVC